MIELTEVGIRKKGCENCEHFDIKKRVCNLNVCAYPLEPDYIERRE